MVPPFGETLYIYMYMCTCDCGWEIIIAKYIIFVKSIKQMSSLGVLFCSNLLLQGMASTNKWGYM